MRTGVGRSALGFAVSSTVIIVLGLVSGWRAAEWLSLVAGLWVGLLLAWGAFQIFGWGRWASRPTYQWGSSMWCLCWWCCSSQAAWGSA